MMKILIVCLSILSLSSFSFGVSKKERTVNKIMSDHTKFVKKNYELQAYGIGSRIPDDVKGFITNYRSNKKLNVEQTRKLFIETSQVLLSSINSNEQLRPYMYKYPFDYNNIEYSIVFYSPSGRRMEEDYIAFASLVKGKIYYDSFDHQKQDFIDRHSETYEEALRIVNETNLE